MSEMNNSNASQRDSDASQTYGEAVDTSLTGLPNTHAGYNIKSVTAELEKRRAELIGLARAAEARARESEKRLEQAEARLREETNQRLLVEQRLRDSEDERLRQQQTVELEAEKTLKATVAHSELEAELKEAEGRIKEAESKAEDLTLALAEADRKWAEAEAIAQVARDDAREIDSLYVGAEARLKDLESRLVEAEERAREEGDARKLAEKALLEITQETDRRSHIDQRIQELEEELLRQQKARQTDEAELYKALLAREDAEARLKDVESRLVEAEEREREAADARKIAEKTLLEADAKSEAASRALAKAENATMALTEANQKRAEAEAGARAIEERARKIEALVLEAEAGVHEATERYKATEAKLQHEIKQRALAEQKLKDFEAELSSYLELDWSKSEPEIIPVGVALDNGVNDPALQFREQNDHTIQLHEQVEVERRARHEAENALAAVELKMREMELALVDAEEKVRRQEDNLRKIIEEEEAKNNLMTEWAPTGGRAFKSHNLAQSVNEDSTYSVKNQKSLSFKLRFVVYGMVLTLLLVLACWLITAAIFRV